jgi:hypothetical protein
MAANVVNTNIKDTIYVNLLSVLEFLAVFSFLFDLKINFSLVKRIIEFYIFV